MPACRQPARKDSSVNLGFEANLLLPTGTDISFIALGLAHLWRTSAVLDAEVPFHRQSGIAHA